MSRHLLILQYLNLATNQEKEFSKSWIRVKQGSAETGQARIYQMHLANQPVFLTWQLKICQSSLVVTLNSCRLTFPQDSPSSAQMPSTLVLHGCASDSGVPNFDCHGSREAPQRRFVSASH